MTVENANESDGAFHGLMRSLNLDAELSQTYGTDFETLNYHQLSLAKHTIENQLSVLFDLLSNKYHANMQTPLLTPDGFPRSDIDVVSIRLIRTKVIRLRNDHRAVLQLLELQLVQQLGADRLQNENLTQEPREPAASSRYTIPYARASEIAPGSPALLAGLREGDEIVLFGHVHAGNHGRLLEITAVVQRNVDRKVAVTVVRNGNQQVVELTPTNNWGGRGLLGCRVVPI